MKYERAERGTKVNTLLADLDGLNLHFDVYDLLVEVADHLEDVLLVCFADVIVVVDDAF